MCGSLRLRSGERIKPGGDLSFRLVNGRVATGPWLCIDGLGGFCREETLAPVWAGKVSLCVLPEVDGWWERERWFPVPDGCLIQAAWDLVGRGLRIVTRPAVTVLEVQTHHRHPLLVKA